MEFENMKLNSIKPAKGSVTNSKRVGRGIGSGFGKTAGRGHKGQKSRSGGFHKVGFEGGQMPLHRRLPKRGFKAPFSKFNISMRLSEIDKSGLDVISKKTLIESGIVNKLTRKIKIFLSGTISRAVKIENISLTKAVKVAVEKAGGSVIDNTVKELEIKK
jgi:large subunit ribosomal protein L15